MMSDILAGANMIYHAAGWLEGGLSMGYEKFVMDLDHCGMMLKMAGGIVVDKESFGRKAYLQTEPGGNFLSTDHTMKHFKKANYQSTLGDAGSYEQWTEDGAITLEQRANSRWKTMLEEYQAPKIDPAIDEALLEFMERKKSSMPDKWY